MHATDISTTHSPPRILVADDQADVLTALNLLLKNEGFAPEFAESPGAVVRAVMERPYDLLLLDMNLNEAACAYRLRHADAARGMTERWTLRVR